MNDRHADDPVANASCRAERSLRICGGNPADRRGPSVPGIERQGLVVRGQRTLNLIERYSSFDVNRKFCRVLRRDPVESGQTYGAIRALKGISELQLGRRADGNDRPLLRRDKF